jgi:hypothetical protein
VTASVLASNAVWMLRFPMLVVAAALALVVAGCGGSGSSSTTPSGSSSTAPPKPKPAPAGVIELRVSGGVAGGTQDLRIEPGGAASLTSDYGAKRTTASFTIPPARYKDIQSKLAIAHLGSLPAPTPTGCADCFSYAISFGGTTFKTDESAVPEPLRPGLAALKSIVDERSGTAD